MDKIDVAIVRELAQAGTLLPARLGKAPSFRAVARNLRLPPGTVRNRIKAMYDNGVLFGSSVYPNPNLLGVIVNVYAVDVSPNLPKRTVVESLKSVDGMLFIQNFHGSLLGLVFVSKDERKASECISKINSITGAKDGMKSRAFYPQCASNLNKEELRLVKRLSLGFKSYAELARELRTSIRTVKRRVSRIAMGRTILSVPTMDYRQISGVVPADLMVSYTSLEVKARNDMEILDLVRDYAIYAGLWHGLSLFSMMIPKVTKATEILDSVKRLEGVKTARLEFVDEHIDLVASLANLI